MATELIIRFALAMNTVTGAVTQYKGYNFNSMIKLGDTLLGSNENGVFSLEDADTDDDVQIEAFFELILSDFGMSNQKRFRVAYVGYEADGDVILKVTCDEGTTYSYTLSPTAAQQLQKSGKVTISREQKGRYFTFRVENVVGSDFSIDSIDVMPVILEKKPQGS